MSDESPGAETRRPLFERLAALLLRVPEDREQLLEVLRQAHDRSLLDDDALSMIQGVLQVAELSAGDVMVPRAQMDVIDISEPPDSILPKVIATAHSRFPVVDGDRDNVVGILHAKLLLRLYGEPTTTLSELLQPPVFIPESKRLNVLLREFRANHTHLAVIVDEYGGTAGLITIEDVLEQIVGDIEDEFDSDETADHIVELAPGPHGERWQVRALADIERLNAVAGSDLPQDEADTVGGLVTCALGRIPERGERIEIGGLGFEVLQAGARQVELLCVERLPAPPPEVEQSDTN
ncbi:MAG: transporter associated domain-containing protein [Burkholderiaceae bacterium]